MSLALLASIVVLGIAVVVFAVHFTGGSRAAHFETVFDAIAAYRGDHPQTDVLDGRLTRGRDAAFLRLATPDRVGFVAVFGQHFLTREIGAPDLSASVATDHAAIIVSLRDFTWKGGRYIFDDTAVASEVASWFPPAALGAPRYHIGSVRHG
ncbi:hypothetical protein [Aliihoeflea sp. 40Bstr573]|uniref:hypothetical protein n=1 Tax=Aliihoeflea sp. 40Bstr573 TaxID=2696467 RepID=UPI0020953F1D|nr:hypothetical protein [Aliihoeflea sp. 40Bstr573]MCO6385669.1 hypothetical protein [Aliihoeflea sp. 40Bstr573]